MKSSWLNIMSCLLGEFFGAAILLFLGCMGCSGQSNSLLQMALNFGFTVMLIIQCFGCVSGAHLNPVITLSAYIMKQIGAGLSLGYICAQLLGSYAGYALLMHILPQSFLPLNSDNGFCMTIPHCDLSCLQAMIIEFIITLGLILFTCSIWDPRYQEYRETLPLKFSLAVTCFGLTAFKNKSPTANTRFIPIMTSSDVVQRLLAEFIGTSILVFIGCLGCAGFETSLLQIALNFGMVVMMLIQSLGCISGAHLSPAITVAACVMNQISPLLSLGYIAAQLLGCYAGYACLMYLIPKTFLPAVAIEEGFCLTMPHPELSYCQAVFIEFIITATLVVFVCSFWDPRNAKYNQTIPLKFCFAIVGLACTAGNFTGASMNPARSLAPALWNNNFKHQGIYWIGPLSAAVIGAYGYKFIFWRDVKVD